MTNYPTRLFSIADVTQLRHRAEADRNATLRLMISGVRNWWQRLAGEDGVICQSCCSSTA